MCRRPDWSVVTGVFGVVSCLLHEIWIWVLLISLALSLSFPFFLSVSVSMYFYVLLIKRLLLTVWTLKINLHFYTANIQFVPGRLNTVKVKVKRSHYSPGQALSFTGVWGSQISGTSAYEFRYFVKPTLWTSLSPKKYSRYSFLLVAKSTSGP
jgi:hypothetical protein